jgi:hypothetical protein
MQKITQKQAEIYVIDKLRSKRYFGAHQILLENIPKGKPSEDKKMIIKAIKSLANKGFLLMKKKHYGVHVSIDPKKIDEIRGYMKSLES